MILNGHTATGVVVGASSRDLKAGVSIVVPVFHSEQILPALYERLTTSMQELGGEYEVIFVEDGGGDGSWGVIERLALDDVRVRGFQMSRNYGQHNALLCGIRAATYTTTVTIDDDLQNPPEEIQTLLGTLVDGVDVAYGTPDRERHGFLRNQASRITKLALQSAMGSETARNVSAFRAFRTTLRDAFEGYRGPFVTVDVLLTWGTTAFTHVVVRHEPRFAGESNYTVGALIRHAFNMMTGFTTLPLQVASVVGFAFTLFGLAVLAYVLISYVVNGVAVQGFAFLASIIAIFSGAQLFALGIIGEYLARVHLRIMDRPSYVVRSQTPGEDGGGARASRT